MTRRFFLKVMTMLGFNFMLPNNLEAKSKRVKDFQMIVLTDSQCEDYNVFKNTVEVAVKNFPNAEVATVIGDLVDNGEALYQWNAWKESAQDLLHKKIFLPVMGNHECYNHEWKNFIPQQFLNQFEFPDNGTDFNGYFYTYDIGNVHFIIVNSQMKELEELIPDMFTVQDEWLRSDKTNLKWKIVLMHRDIYDYKIDDYHKVGKKFMPIFEKMNVDLVLTGHIHTYRRRKQQKNKPLYICCGVSGDQRYVEPENEVDEVSATPQDNFMILDSSKNSLRIRCFDVDENLIDDFTLKK